MEFKLNEQGNITIVDVISSGRDDENNDQELINIINQLIDREKMDFLFDLGGIRDIKSSEIGLLSFLNKHIRKNYGSLKFCNLSSDVEHLFTLTYLYKQVEVYETREEALESYKNDNK